MALQEVEDEILNRLICLVWVVAGTAQPLVNRLAIGGTEPAQGGGSPRAVIRPRRYHD